MESATNPTAFFRLPKELRLAIYDLVFKDSPSIRVGNHDINSKELADWPVQPGVSRACRLFRSETLGMYYSTAHIVLNIQRSSGESMVLAWLGSLGKSIPEELNGIRLVSIICGLGYNEPPKEYKVDLQLSSLVSATRPAAAAYLYVFRLHNRLSLTPLISGALKKRLQQLPTSKDPDFDVCNNLRVVIATVGELSGYGLSGHQTLWIGESSKTSLANTKDKPATLRVSTLLQLPRELRLAIYEQAFTSASQVTIGQWALRHRLLTDGSSIPGLLHTCSLIRQEALPIYFARTHFVLNVQRTLCESVVFEWIYRCSTTYGTAFQSLRHVSVIAGTGIREPPLQYEFDLQQKRLVSAIRHPVLQPFTVAAADWHPPFQDELLGILEQLPRKGHAKFETGQNLKTIIDFLTRASC